MYPMKIFADNNPEFIGLYRNNIDNLEEYFVP
jgi:hypothetical protein